MTPAHLALLVAFVGVPLNWLVVWKLWRLPERRTNRVLQERTLVAICLAIVVTVFAVIFLSNDSVPPPIPLDVTRWLTRAVLLVASIIPPVYWLWLYR